MGVILKARFLGILVFCLGTANAADTTLVDNRDLHWIQKGDSFEFRKTLVIPSDTGSVCLRNGVVLEEAHQEPYGLNNTCCLMLKRKNTPTRVPKRLVLAVTDEEHLTSLSITRAIEFIEKETTGFSRGGRVGGFEMAEPERTKSRWIFVKTPLNLVPVEQTAENPITGILCAGKSGDNNTAVNRVTVEQMKRNLYGILEYQTTVDALSPGRVLILDDDN